MIVAVDVFQECLEVDDWQTIQKLVAAGIDQSIALKLVQFVPLAFCRYMLKGTGVGFSPHYQLVESGSNKSLELCLADEPVYEEALIAAERVFASGLGQYYYSVAGRSAEFNAINSALNAGSKLENQVCSAPVIENGILLKGAN